VDLQADSATVRYDLDMLLATADRYGKAEAAGDCAGQNMAVESFAIHCRALILFLFGHVEGLQAVGQSDQRFAGSRPNDVFAWDYYPGWQADCPEPAEELFHAKWRADKHVMHIVTERRGVNQAGTGRTSVWKLRDTVNEIARVMALFISKAPAGNFNAEELRMMKERQQPWSGGVLAPALPFTGTSGQLNQPGLLAHPQVKPHGSTTSSSLTVVHNPLGKASSSDE
jgi:hypothetical protein